MHVVQHTTTVSAPAELLYDLVADALNWPVILGPTVHVERLASEDSVELLRLWATANGEVRTWTSKRTLDRANMRITFRQQESPTPLASMGGAWTLQPLSATETRVVLDHDFSVVDDDPEATSWFAKAVDSNSTAELTAMKELAERWAERSALTISFSDSVRIRATARQVYDYLNETDKWPERIPHVSRAELTEDAPGLQVMVMDTSTADGTVHTTRSVRVCFPHDRIVYKQVETPALMSVHTGEWTLEQDADGVLATSRHTVVIRLEAVPEVLGPGASSADALQFVRAALSRNSTATLNHAKDFVESAGVHASTRA
jgi:ribosome-associated toxin RatA of RatAB toxin-antitoxin module